MYEYEFRDKITGLYFSVFAHFYSDAIAEIEDPENAEFIRKIYVD